LLMSWHNFDYFYGTFMNKQTQSALTRADLAQSLHDKLGFSVNDCGQLVESVFERVSTALEQGETTKIVGFGTGHPIT
jgi:hypothetical protein